jgi:simple sugar transport system permease protein
LIKFIPLLLTTYAFAIPFKLRIYNIGALGQMQVGGLAVIIVAFELAFLPSALLIPLSILGALAGAGAFSAVTGWMRNRYGINPIISTTMLNFVGLYLVLFITTFGRYEDPFSGHPMTESLPDAAILPRFGQFPSSLILAAIVIVLGYLVMKKTHLGFKIEASGFNWNAARIYGINVERLIVITLFLGGAMAGLAGAVQVMSVQERLIEGFALTSGAEFGTFGILTALICKGEPRGVPVAAFFMSVLLVGADAMQRTLQIPVEMVFLMQAILVILIVIIRKRMEGKA